MDIRKLILIIFILVGCTITLHTANAQAACTHFASPNGGGNGMSTSTPFRISNFWGVASPGKTLCLLDGTYTGGDSMIQPPAGLKGTQSNPITVRALNDGKVLIDAQHNGFAVYLGWHGGNSNDWFVVEGINARNGLEALITVSGANNIIRRVIGWDGTEGQGDSNIFRIVGYGSVAEDCAGWGNNSRKIFDGAQAGNLQQAGFRRCWGEWNDWPSGGSWPINTYQGGYNTTNQIFENVLGTTRVLGDRSPGDHEGVMRWFRGGGRPPFDMQGSKLLGAIFYTTPDVTNMGDALWNTDEMANFYAEDSVFFVDSDRGSSVQPWNMFRCIVDGQCFNNVCKNCLAVHDGAPGSAAGNSGWSFPNLHQGQGLAAATGGQSAFKLLPGICKRYVRGQLTNQPLWPWPMNERIKEARAMSGKPVVDVNAQIESILGPIPPECKGSGGGTTTPPPAPPPMGDNCSDISSSTTLPQGFGSPMNFFTNPATRTINAFCDNDDVTAQIAKPTSIPYHYTYIRGYQWKAATAQWSPITYACDQGLISAAWCPGTATSDLDPDDPSFIAYTCSYINNTWKCGCRDQTCSQNLWQVQRFDN